MSEQPGYTLEPQQPERSLEQIVADLHYYDEHKYGPDRIYDFGPDYGPAYSFKQLLGYPDPIGSVWRMEPQERLTGDETLAEATRRMAIDVYQYEVQTQERQGQQGEQPMPSFEEMYGYPDPRQTGVAEAPGPVGPSE